VAGELPTGLVVELHTSECCPSVLAAGGLSSSQQAVQGTQLSPAQPGAGWEAGGVGPHPRRYHQHQPLQRVRYSGRCSGCTRQKLAASREQPAILPAKGEPKGICVSSGSCGGGGVQGRHCHLCSGQCPDLPSE